MMISAVLHAKLDRLKDVLRATGGCVVAFSGGVDSTLLLTVAHEVLGDRCLAIIATSSTYPRREYEEAVRWVEERGIAHVTLVSEELDIPGFSDNPPDRCYHCKKELFTKIQHEAAAHGFSHIADGTNADDASDYRPGSRAADELGVMRPLREAGLTKQDIRTLSREIYHLPTADKPAMACLASRFPYGSPITREKLRQVEIIEDFLARNGLAGTRARHHGDVLRLEAPPNVVHRLLEPQLRVACITLGKQCGFAYITLDLEGYRTGSMNEVLGQSQPAETP